MTNPRQPIDAVPGDSDSEPIALRQFVTRMHASGRVSDAVIDAAIAVGTLKSFEHAGECWVDIQQVIELVGAETALRNL